MSVQSSLNESIRALRARAERYRSLAEGLYDRRTAAEVAEIAEELEAEAVRLELWQGAPRPLFAGNTALST